MREVPKIFVINLKKSKTRRLYIEQQLSKLNLYHEIVEATDGRALSKEEMSLFISFQSFKNMVTISQNFKK